MEKCRKIKKFFPLFVWFCLSMVLFISPNLVSAAENDKEVHHEGDLVIDGVQTYVIEDVRFFQDGSIVVKDSAKLIIRNAEVMVNSTYPWRYWVKVFDNASVLIENSVLQTYSQMNLSVHGGSVDMINTTCCWAITADGGNVTIHDSQMSESVLPLPIEDETSPMRAVCLFWKAFAPGKVEITNSSLARVDLTFAPLDLLKSGPQEDIHISRLEPAKKTDLLIQTMEGASFEMCDSSVEMWLVEVSTYSRKRLLISDSQLDGVYLTIVDVSNAKMSDLKPGIFGDDILLNTMDAGYLRLVNTEIIDGKDAPFKLLIYGSDVLVENCQAIQIAPWGDAQVIVKDSIVERNVNLRGNETVTFVNTTITSLINFWVGQVHDEKYGGDHHILEFDDSRIDTNAAIEVACDYGEIKGNVTIHTSLDHVLWFFGTIKREFPVTVMNGENNPVSGLSFQLIDSRNEVVWNGTTDESGKIFPMITFDENNYTEEWRLVSLDGVFTKTLSLLTTTPVLIYPTSGDLRETETTKKSPQQATTQPTSTPETTLIPIPSTHKGVNWQAITCLITGLVIVSISIYFFIRRRRRHAT